MIPSAPIQAAARLAETLAIGAAGGAVFALIGLPAGWLSGSVLAVAIAALAGRPAHVPATFMRGIFVLFGIILGAAVTPETLKSVGRWPLSVIALILCTWCVIAATAMYLRFVHRWDVLSAVFAAAPGALSQVVAMTLDYRADLRAIVIVQTIRVAILAIALPAGLAALGWSGSAGARTAMAGGQGSFLELAVLVALSTLAALLLLRLRFPGNLLFGAMIASGALHGSGFVSAALPSWLAIVAMVALGAVVGARFAQTTLAMLMRYMGAALGSFAVAIAVTTIFAVGVTHLLSLHLADVVIAFAPGALDTMMILALALALDPVFIGAHHLARFVVISLSLPVLAPMVARKAPAPAPRVRGPSAPQD
jgi:membrane AbrB-like protein